MALFSKYTLSQRKITTSRGAQEVVCAFRGPLGFSVVISHFEGAELKKIGAIILNCGEHAVTATPFFSTERILYLSF